MSSAEKYCGLRAEIVSIVKEVCGPGAYGRQTSLRFSGHRMEKNLSSAPAEGRFSLESHLISDKMMAVGIKFSGTQESYCVVEVERDGVLADGIEPGPIVAHTVV